MAVLSGTVFSGLGKGQFFLSRNGYRVQLRRILGFDPAPGTLNLRVEPANRHDFIGGIRGFDVTPFEEANESFGALWVYPIQLRDKEPAGIVVPEQTEYDEDVVEIVCAHHLRERFGLRDGDAFRVFTREESVPTGNSKYYQKGPL